MWAPNVQALSTEYRTFAVDQINNWGRTICTKTIRSFDDLIAWLDELLEGLAPGRKVNLAGLSYGGAVAAQFALRFPAKLDKVVLLAPGNTVLRVRTEFMLRVIPFIVA